MDWDDVLIKTLEKLPGGIGILAAIAIIVVLFPIYKQIRAYMDEQKKQKSEEEELKLKNIATEREFRKSVENTLEKVPTLAEKLENLASNMSNFQSMKNEFNLSSTQFTDMFTGLTTRVNDLENTSNTQDNDIQKNIVAIMSSLDHVSTKMGGIEKKVDTLISGDLDEFRAYLLHIHTEVVIRKSVKMTYNEVEIVRLKYLKYRKEGGNGWAEKMYYELFNETTQDGQNIGEIINDIDAREKEAYEDNRYFIEDNIDKIN